MSTSSPPPPPPPQQQSNDQALPPQTPERRARRQQSVSSSTIQSAPPGKRTMHFVGSPAAQQRNRETFEIVQVTRTLKEGLTRLKAMVDPTTTPLSPTRRPMRAFRAHSANSPLVSPPRRTYRQLSRHSSMAPHNMAGREGMFSCPQRLERRAESSVGRGAPRFDLARGNKEDERAAETMILFMNSEHSSQQASPVSPPEPRPRVVELESPTRKRRRDARSSTGEDEEEEEEHGGGDLSLLAASKKRLRSHSEAFSESTEEYALSEQTEESAENEQAQEQETGETPTDELAQSTGSEYEEETRPLSPEDG